MKLDRMDALISRNPSTLLRIFLDPDLSMKRFAVDQARLLC